MSKQPDPPGNPSEPQKNVEDKSQLARASWPPWPPRWPETRCKSLHSADLRSYRGKGGQCWRGLKSRGYQTWRWNIAKPIHPPKAFSKPSRIDQVHQEDPGIQQNQMALHSWTQILVVRQNDKTSMSCSHRKEWYFCQELESKTTQNRVFLLVKCMREDISQFWTFRWGWPQNSSPSSSQTSKMQRLERTCRNCPDWFAQTVSSSNYCSPPKRTLNIYLMREPSWLISW